MSKKKKLKLGMSKIHRYAKSRLGYSGGSFISPYETACKSLEVDGKPKPSAYTYKSWVLHNADFILIEAENLRVKGNTKASPSVEAAIKSLASAKRRSGLTIDKSPDPIQTKFKCATVDVKSDLFLQSYEWRRIRMVALKKHGATCQCCGASPKTGAVMNVDHIKPRKLFPELALDVNNLQVLCGVCNHGKGNWDETDWR